MLIRSQNKQIIININASCGLSVCEHGDKKEYTIVSHCIDGSHNFIGNYSTEEKAIKVLDMIEDKFDSLNMYKCNPDDGYVGAYFNMPQESEVM